MTLNGASPLVAHFYAMQYRIPASTRIQCLQLHFDNGGHPRYLWFLHKGMNTDGDKSRCSPSKNDVDSGP